MACLTSLTNNYRRPSETDLAALVLAKTNRAILVTGDKELRKIARHLGVNVHGVLWVLDMLVNSGIITGAQARGSLSCIIQGGSYLPQKEVQRCFAKWR